MCLRFIQCNSFKFTFVKYIQLIQTDNNRMKKKGDKQKDAKAKIDYWDLINKNLQDFRAVYDYSGYQFTKLNLNTKSLDVLSPVFKQFKYLETIDLSNNSVADLTHLAALPNLAILYADHNNVKDFKAFGVEQGWKSLRILSLNYNKIAELTSLASVANLNELYLTQNKIEKVQNFGGHPKLKILELRRNKISSLQGLGAMEQLIQLYLSDNKIKSLAGLEIPKIQKLHLRKNVIVAFDETFPAFEQLTYLNLRQNSIQKLQQIQKTKQLPNLKQIIFSQNPFIIKYENYLLDAVNANLKLHRINKTPVTKSLKLRAFKYAEDKWQNEENEKKRAEEERLRAQKQAQQKQAEA